MKTIGVLVGVALFVGWLFAGMLLAYAIISESAHVSEPQHDPDEDEQICRDSMSIVMAGSSQSDTQFRQRILVYEDCIAARAERRRHERDALDAEYLERLQACEQRYEEIYGAWMACADPDEVEREDDAGCPAAAR